MTAPSIAVIRELSDRRLLNDVDESLHTEIADAIVRTVCESANLLTPDEKDKTIDYLASEIDAARREAHCCDDIKLDQPLTGIIADLQTDRERLHDVNTQMLAALKEAAEFIQPFNRAADLLDRIDAAIEASR